MKATVRLLFNGGLDYEDVPYIEAPAPRNHCLIEADAAYYLNSQVSDRDYDAIMHGIGVWLNGSISMGNLQDFNHIKLANGTVLAAVITDVRLDDHARH